MELRIAVDGMATHSLARAKDRPGQVGGGAGGPDR